jgi:hypothetical protein
LLEEASISSSLLDYVTKEISKKIKTYLALLQQPRMFNSRLQKSRRKKKINFYRTHYEYASQIIVFILTRVKDKQKENLKGPQKDDESGISILSINNGK